ncbi:uncharacterized protein G2W53_034579 [Senna tora]|uniref:Uncharacterized protein n=1 Tax=Senna tora TaxID=362788 RepID=A0A834W9Q8_9FABA|nr:uncharacterized protein G2W53_034579 [Senna tora]
MRSNLENSQNANDDFANHYFPRQISDFMVREESDDG